MWKKNGEVSKCNERERERKQTKWKEHTHTHTSRSDSTIITPFWQWKTIWVDEITKQKCKINLSIEKLFDNEEKLYDKTQDYCMRLILCVENDICVIVVVTFLHLPFSQ